VIRAMIFDLDGTLVQTEKLKAMSYAQAAEDLCPRCLTQEEAMEGFKEFVGLSRSEVAKGLIKLFGLEELARGRMDEFDVDAPWQAFVQVRLKHYEELLSDPQVILDNICPYNMALLKEARDTLEKVALATMSHCEQAQKILHILKIHDLFDFVAARDDVDLGKPDPQIYHLVASELGMSGKECLVVEDSATGVNAAINAGMWYIAVGTDFTRKGLHADPAIDKQRIVDDPALLLDVARNMIAEKRLESL
jgi:beta-phosphoglucomutase